QRPGPGPAGGWRLTDGATGATKTKSPAGDHPAGPLFYLGISTYTVCAIVSSLPPHYFVRKP
ncbi:hypothetical protein, partial [Ralstonia pseudosolanacearum]|uniref:hypothetical protein n=1 Tax=Ralstonia pseudosolanacearum TaxID=1310165 RepID=UPI003AAEB0BD